MEKGDNKAFENIINGNEFDDRLSRALNMFDTETDNFYKDFDALTEDIKNQGISTKTPSLMEKGYALELVVNEILHQDYDFDEKVEEVCGIARADMSDMLRYLCAKAGTEYTQEKQDTIPEFDRLMKQFMYELKDAGADIPKEFSDLYLLVSDKLFSTLVTEMAIRFYRDNQ